ncbi:MAG: monovalent cation/H(+) antiporter subunit G [Amphiplicatus sp.]|jgi:multicomponent Na+:H+ antiporter subunit G
MTEGLIDWGLIRDLASWGLFLIGSAAVVTGAIGIVRFPDFYTRVHAAGVTDTGGAELIIVAMMLQAPNWLVAAKLAFIGIFLFFTSPVATHAIAHAAWVSGLKPLLGPELKREGER